MAAEASNLVERGMVLMRVGEREAVGEKFQDILLMIRSCPRPMTLQFAYPDSEVLLMADLHFGPRRKRRRKKLPAGPKKVLRGKLARNLYDGSL